MKVEESAAQQRRDNVLVNTQASEYNIYSHSGDGSHVVAARLDEEERDAS